MLLTLTTNSRVEELIDVITMRSTAPAPVGQCRPETKPMAERAVALVLVDADGAAYRLYAQRNENEQRDRMTIQVCTQFAIAMCDAVYMYENARQDLLGISSKARRLLPAPQPSYAQIRDYLAYDLGARYLDACFVAARVSTPYLGTWEF